MLISRRALVSVFVAAIAALSMAFAAGAFGATRTSHRSRSSHPGERHGVPLVKEALAPSQTTDPKFHSVAPGGAPWVLKRGEVRLRRDGKLDLRVEGLVIPALGTAGPVTTISASLYCGADANTTAAGTTQQVPLSRNGDARIDDTTFSVPSTCLAPVILVHPNGIATLYIALGGWRL